MTITAQKMKFSIMDFFSKCNQILNEKLHFLCSVCGESVSEHVTKTTHVPLLKFSYEQNEPCAREFLLTKPSKFLTKYKYSMCNFLVSFVSRLLNHSYYCNKQKCFIDSNVSYHTFSQHTIVLCWKLIACPTENSQLVKSIQSDIVQLYPTQG